MKLGDLITWCIGVIIGLAGVHHIDDIHRGILNAQAMLIYESRASNCGTPRFLK